MKNVAITPASILWLPDNDETRQIAGMDNGRLNHPVLVLSNPDIERQSSTSANIQILIVGPFTVPTPPHLMLADHKLQRDTARGKVSTPRCQKDTQRVSASQAESS